MSNILAKRVTRLVCGRGLLAGTADGGRVRRGEAAPRRDLVDRTPDRETVLG